MRQNMAMPEPREPEILDESLWRFVTQLQKGGFYGVAELHYSESNFTPFGRPARQSLVGVSTV